MTAYSLGNLVGRLLLSYLVVWLVCVVLARGDWRRAFRLSRTWKGMLGLVVVFVLGIAGGLAR